MALLFTGYYSVGSSGVYSFIIEPIDDKDHVSPMTTDLTSQNVDCFIDVGDFLLSQSMDVLYMSS